VSELDNLQARVQELERRVDLLFTNTGAIDMEEAGRDAPEASPEVQQLLQQGKLKKAARLYMKETGADMFTTMGALEKLREGG